jgi:branched-chain amino acid transport system substrate-binding protein
MFAKRIVVAGVATLQLLVLACGGAGTPTSSSGPIQVKIAHLADLTGAIKDANKFQIEGMEIALSEVNSAPNAKYKITIDRQDTGADPAKALALMKDVAANPDYVLQIGPPSSTEFFAAIPQAAKLKMPILSMVSGGYYSGTFNQYVFRTSFPDTSAMPALIDYAKNKLNAKSMGSVYANDSDSPRTNGEQMAKLAQSKGFKVSSYSFSTKDVDFSAQVSKIASDKPDVLFVSVLPAQLPFLLKAIKAGGITSKIISTSSVFSGDLKAIYSNSGGAADGVVVSTAFDPQSSRQIVKDYTVKFKQLHPDQSISFDVYGYDAVKVIANALTQVNGAVTRESLMAAFAKVNVDGLTGQGITFPNGYGDVSRRSVSLKLFTSPGVFGADAS